MASRTRGIRRALRLALCALVAAPLGVGLGVALKHEGLLPGTSYGIDHAALAAAAKPGPGLRVLFIGNSFTYQNDMPEMVRKLALSAAPGRPLRVATWTPTGQLLSQAAASASVEQMLHAVPWDVVVLQEQTQQLSYPETWWGTATLPYARRLHDAIAAIGARTLLFETWGFRNGTFPGDTFEQMTARLEEGNSRLAADLGVPVAPVGEAFWEAIQRNPGAALWAADDTHPSVEGSYLAADVLFAELYGASAEGSTYDAGLAPADARSLRAAAAFAVAHP